MEGIISVCEGEGCYSQSEQTLKRLFDFLLEGIKQSTDPTQTRFIHHYLDKLLLLSPEERDKLVKEIDRKSTRLNSSHVAISYAVFCLKKKKQIQTRKHQK